MSRRCDADLMRASRAALPVAGAAAPASRLVLASAGSVVAVALLLFWLVAFAGALRLVVFASLLLAFVAALAEVAGCAEGVERLVVDSEPGADVLSGPDGFRAASAWQQDKSSLHGAHMLVGAVCTTVLQIGPALAALPAAHPMAVLESSDLAVSRSAS